MKTILPAWDSIAAEADARRAALLESVRSWAARAHARSRDRETRSRIAATLDGLSRPIRTRLVSRDAGATDRDRAEAAADDLWDATAQVWVLVRSARKTDPGTEHVVAELSEVGRWLADFPVLTARHDREIDRLFERPKESPHVD